MELAASADISETENHPLALRMGLIAALGHNMVIGCIFGTFSVMLASVETRMGVSVEEAAVGIPLVVVGSSLMAVGAGVLVARYSLRLLLLLGALISTAAFLLLAFSSSYALYLAAYVLMGPAMALAGSVGPATLVTRWFTKNRGLALGLVHLPIMVTILPVLSNWVYEQYGAPTTYLMLAALIGIGFAPLTFFVVDHPPEQESTPAMVAQATGAQVQTMDGSLTVGQLLSSGRFWAFAIASSAVATGAVTLGAVLVPMAVSLGFDRADGALLASIMAFVGMGGSVLFGWVADRIGGPRGLAVLTLGSAVLWGLLLIDPPFMVMAIIVGLLGLCGAGMIPNLSRGLADSFGPASFSRGFGLATTFSLPFVVLAVPGFPGLKSLTGSYAAPIMVMSVFFLFAFACALSISRR